MNSIENWKCGLVAFVLVAFLAGSAPMGAATEADPAQADQAAIESILDADKAAHLSSDATLMAPHLAETLIEVSAGEVASRSREDILSFFRGYFEGAVFHEWTDTHPAIIRISDDGTLAWVIRRVRADREAPNGERSQYTSAYTATYRKSAGQWRMTSVTSTFLPPP